MKNHHQLLHVTSSLPDLELFAVTDICFVLKIVQFLFEPEIYFTDFTTHKKFFNRAKMFDTPINAAKHLVSLHKSFHPCA